MKVREHMILLAMSYSNSVTVWLSRTLKMEQRVLLYSYISVPCGDYQDRRVTNISALTSSRPCCRD
ncbi:hypothetical protein FOMG_18749 [Fusarium oxysporum f. sp. melonis 26406]|uniref:Uncharacterized protein n=1 Tax=Fusarium oxysporum f. sp. melonis 26406 TaxID=1089452 RepID=W9ZTX7_FUSOX|nr:hypothetical protein FOMG_18749 [Fusarium oxysporum f. sp. melonis 26406]